MGAIPTRSGSHARRHGRNVRQTNRTAARRTRGCCKMTGLDAVINAFSTSATVVSCLVAFCCLAGCGWYCWSQRKRKKKAANYQAANYPRQAAWQAYPAAAPAILQLLRAIPAAAPGLSCSRSGLSCSCSGLSCSRSGLSCSRSGIPCIFSELSRTSSGLSCTSSGIFCTSLREILPTRSIHSSPDRQ